MKKQAIIGGGLIYLIAAFALSLLVIKPPKPIIDIKGEKLVTIVKSSNDALTVAVTNTLFTAWVAMALLLIVCVIAMKKKALVPEGFYNFFESIVEAILTLVTSIAGERNARKFFPLVATFLIYITFANWLSLTPVFNTIGIYVHPSAEKSEYKTKAVVFKDSGISYIAPGAKSIDIDDSACNDLTGDDLMACRQKAIDAATQATVKSGEKAGTLAPYFRGINTDLMTPLSFALVSAFFVELWGVQELGFTAYFSKFINFRGPIDFFVGILEFIAELARLISFSFRLFGNMMAGEILLLVMTFLVAVVSPILVFFYGLELFVGAVQAFVFGTLTLVFAVLAVSHHGPEESMREGVEDAHPHH